jgi:hypothetical protein
MLVLAVAGTGLADSLIENVIVVTIDGLRNDEGFESGATNMPRMWNDLRPLGAIYRRFWNRGWTATTGGHTTILSGVRQVFNNNGSADGTVRSFDPLLFEYFREYLSQPASAGGVVFGKSGNFGNIADFGLEPAFGERRCGTRWGSDSTHDDTVAIRLLFSLMDSTHPRLVLINLACVDNAGHAGVYDSFLVAVRVADSVVYEMYKRIQAIPPYTDTTYRDRTLLIVTTDHGRNDDAHGSFKGHAGWDHGCRDLIFWAFGPGIRQGALIDAEGDQIDIVPTVGAALGFPTPFAEGRVLSEMFETGRAPLPVRAPGGAVLERNLSNSPGFSRDPDVCRDREGNLHLVWSDDTPDGWRVLYSRSTDEGANWSGPQRLFDYPTAESVMWYARVAADDSLAVAATGFGRRACYIDSVEPRRLDTTYLWYPWIATSADQGASWQESALFDSSMGSYYPGVSVRDGRLGLAWWACGKMRWETTRKGLLFNYRAANGAWDSVPKRVKNAYMVHVALADDGTRFHAVTCAMDGDEDSDIWYVSSTGRGGWTTDSVTSDPFGAPVYDHDPELVLDDSGMVHVFWARKPDSGGVWRVMYGRRDPGTGTWDTLTLVAGTAAAHQPHAAIKGDTIALVWVDYRDGASEVYATTSSDRGLSWLPPAPVTAARSLTQHPRVCPQADGFFVVWQSLSAGNWDIFGEPVFTHTALTGADAPRALPARLPTLVRRVLTLPSASCTLTSDFVLFDASGRRILPLRPGPNDVSRLSPGVYFVRGAGSYKVLVQR